MTPRSIILELERRNLAECSVLFTLFFFVTLLAFGVGTAALHGFIKDSLPYFWIVPMLCWVGVILYFVHLIYRASRSWDDSHMSTGTFHLVQFVALGVFFGQSLLYLDFRFIVLFALVFEVVLILFYGSFFFLSLVIRRWPPVSAYTGFILVIASTIISANHLPRY